MAGRATSERSRLLRGLLDLAYDASLYLRQNRQQAVRVSAALLLAASLAACDEESPPFESTESDTPVASPLAQEVRSGLPAAPGRYPIVRDSLQRDTQGVYHFSWREAGSLDGPPHVASASLVRLAYAEIDELEIPSQGDPVLYLRSDTPIPLVASANQVTATPQPGGGGAATRTMWFPFPIGGGSYAGRGPTYYDPPSRTVPSGGTVEGASASTAPRPLAERTVGLSHAVSGRAGGTGSGTAASARSGAGVRGASGVAAPNSSGFSAGKAGAASGSSS